MKTLNTGRIFLLRNRGILLDVFVFLSGIFLMRLLTGSFIELTRAPDEDVWAKVAVALFYTAMLVLTPLGAILKKHQFWKRVEEQGKKERVEKNVRRFIFSPWFCFVWLLIVYAFAVVSWSWILSPDFLFGSSTIIILTVFFGGMIYCFLAALIISNFYEDGYGTPFWQLHVKGADYDLLNLAEVFFEFDFLQTRLAAWLGDLCVYLNMICFQIFWGYLFSDLYGGGVQADGEILSAAIVYLLMLCLFYFPPRNFYLAEDVHRPIVWLTITLANLPSFLYFFFRLRIF